MIALTTQPFLVFSENKKHTLRSMFHPLSLPCTVILPTLHLLAGHPLTSRSMGVSQTDSIGCHTACDSYFTRLVTLT
jgi:hypothetical protein